MRFKRSIPLIEKLKFKGHIVDSMALSRLLDIISELDVVCYVENITTGKRREDESEAIFVIETDNKVKMLEAIEIAKRKGAKEL